MRGSTTGAGFAGFLSVSGGGNVVGGNSVPSLVGGMYGGKKPGDSDSGFVSAAEGGAAGPLATTTLTNASTTKQALRKTGLTNGRLIHLASIDCAMPHGVDPTAMTATSSRPHGVAPLTWAERGGEIGCFVRADSIGDFACAA